jgi:hypothetical protein
MEAAAAKEKGQDVIAEPLAKPVESVGVDEDASPVAGRRFTRTT